LAVHRRDFHLLYLALVFVPIALASPTFSPIWLVPQLGWLVPTELTQGDLKQILRYLAIEAILIARLISTRPIERPGTTISPGGRRAADAPALG
jgi:hypothetical protein